jgi:ABC-type oligopeptide transport system substrate-binding subunit
MRGRSALVVLIVSLTMVAAACSSSKKTSTAAGGSSGTPVVGGDLIDLYNYAGGDATHIDPALASDINSSQIGELVFATLTAADPKTGKLQPSIATKWEGNSDSTQWTFHLQKTNFSNGDPVLPSSFKYAWERVIDPKLASDVSYHFKQIQGSKDVQDGKAKTMSGITADDGAMTLTVKMSGPASDFPEHVSHLAFAPVPEKIVSALPDHGLKWEEQVMIGNGPFIMAEPWKHDQYIKLARNAGYWGGPEHHKAYLNTITFKVSKDVDSAYTDFQAGNADTAQIPPGKYTAAKAQYPGHTLTDPILGYYYMGFNLADKAVGGPENVKLRQAISLAIDRDKINTQVYNSGRVVATGVTPPGVPGYKPGLAKYVKYDPTQARTLLSEWKTATGKTTPPTIYLDIAAGKGHEPVMAIIQANLKDIGITATVRPHDSKTYFDEMRAGKGQLLRGGWIQDYISYDNTIYPVFDSESIKGDNLMQYQSKVFDGLINRARATSDETARFKLYNEAEDLILNGDAVAVPIVWYAGNVVFSTKLHDVVQTPLDFILYQNIWIKA